MNRKFVCFAQCYFMITYEVVIRFSLPVHQKNKDFTIVQPSCIFKLKLSLTAFICFIVNMTYYITYAALVFTMFKMITREKLHTWISNARVIPGV